MAKTYTNILKYGTQAAYNALETKETTALYFCTDTKKIYKGTIDFTDSVVFAAAKSGVTAPIIGKLYVFADTGICEVYNGSTWVPVSYPLTTTLSDASTDAQVPSAKAVYDYVDGVVEAIGGSTDIVKSISYDDDSTNGPTLTYTTADNTSHDLTLDGVAYDPTWDSSTRILTIPVVGGEDVVVNIGKDIFVDSSANNRYDSTDESLHIFLNDGKAAVGTEGEAGYVAAVPSTEIVIPVASLIDIYTGDSTSTATVSVSSGNVITADVRLKANVAGSAAVGEPGDPGYVAAVPAFTNAIQVDTTNGGIYVDLSDYYTKSTVDAIRADLDALEIAVGWGTF